MGALMLFVSMLLFVPVTVQAEVVSIMLSTPGYDGMMVEAAMKQQLREEGYTVRTGTTEGIVVLLNVIAPKTTQGHQPGYVGHVTLWRRSRTPPGSSASHAKALKTTLPVVPQV